MVMTILALLVACTTPQNNLLVPSISQHSREDKSNFLSDTQNSTLVNRLAADYMDTIPLARNRPAFHSMVLELGHTGRHQTRWIIHSPSYYLKVGSRLKDSKPAPEHRSKVKNQQSSPAKKSDTKQKKSIVSIDNKKMVVLNFGWPIKGKVLKRFSPPGNKGIDIAGKQGQSIKAAEAGKVVYGGQGLIGFGKLLIIKHNDEYLSAYAKNRRLLVNEGQQVKKGQVIAEAGKVGSKRTSLHFEIRKNGIPVNPLQLLPKK